MKPGSLPEDSLKAFFEAENQLRSQMDEQGDISNLASDIANAGWQEPTVESVELSEERILGKSLLESWFNTGRDSSYGSMMALIIGNQAWDQLKGLLVSALSGRSVMWRSAVAIFQTRTDGTGPS